MKYGCEAWGFNRSTGQIDWTKTLFDIACDTDIKSYFAQEKPMF